MQHLAAPSCRFPIPLLLASALVTALVPAQDDARLRSWLPDGYSNIASVDLELLRDRGIWEELQLSVLGATFGGMEKELGFPLAALDKVLMVASLTESSAKAQEVRLLVGNRELPAATRNMGSYQQEQVGKHEVWVRDSYRREYFLRPEPTLQVFGTALALDPILGGQAHGGLPCPDVMSLLSRPSTTFACFVLDVSAPVLRTRMMRAMFPDTTWPEGHEPTFFCVRGLITGDADDPHLTVEATMRHAKEGEGLQVTAKAIDALLERLAAEPTQRTLASLLKKAERQQLRSDYVLTLDLGRARAAAGNLALLVLPLFAPVRAEPAAARAAAPVPAPAPAPAEPLPR